MIIYIYRFNVKYVANTYETCLHVTLKNVLYSVLYTVEGMESYSVLYTVEGIQSYINVRGPHKHIGGPDIGNSWTVWFHSMNCIHIFRESCDFRWNYIKVILDR